MNLKNWSIVLLALLVLFSGCLSQQPDNYGINNNATNNNIANNNASEILTLKGLNFNTNLTYGREMARAQEKPVFVYVRSEDCGWCRKFEQETFTNQSVIKNLNENFILVSLDVYKQKEERRYFRVQGTPTEIFLNPDGTEIQRIPGYTDTQTFLNLTNDIINKMRQENEAGK